MPSLSVRQRCGELKCGHVSANCCTRRLAYKLCHGSSVAAAMWSLSHCTSACTRGLRGGVEMVRAADVVVTMGCGDACPLFPGKRYEDWELEDPAGRDVEHVRPIRDEIRGRVEVLRLERTTGFEPATLTLAR